MLPCSIGSREWCLRVNAFKKLTIQQCRVPKGEKSGGEKRDSNPRKGVHKQEELNSRKKYERKTR